MREGAEDPALEEPVRAQDGCGEGGVGVTQAEWHCTAGGGVHAALRGQVRFAEGGCLSENPSGSAGRGAVRGDSEPPCSPLQSPGRLLGGK